MSKKYGVYQNINEKRLSLEINKKREFYFEDMDDLRIAIKDQVFSNTIEQNISFIESLKIDSKNILQDYHDKIEKGSRQEYIKTINIFLASSKELEAERKSFEIFISRENTRLVGEGIFLRLNIWENFIDAMSKTRLQDEYNNAIISSDIFISLFFTKVGRYTDEEFETAYGQFIKFGKPFIYTYFKNSNVKSGEINKDDFLGLHNFKNKLSKLGHFPTEFNDSNDLESKFRIQLDKLKNKL